MPSLPDLPLTARLGECAELLLDRGLAVLAAEPGSGKTTLVPIGLMEALPGRILVAEPRRVAAAQAAARIAWLLGEEAGGRAGYAVRGESRQGKGTRILCVTGGVLLRMVQDDPGLAGVSAVVFDEFHERSLDGDLALAFCLDVRASLRPDLRLLIMSATLDMAACSAFLRGAAGSEPGSLTVPGAPFPVETRHAPAAGRLEDAVARAVERAMDEVDGDVLVFLPGMRELESARSALGGAGGAETLLLHGGLSLEEQRRIVRGGGRGRRVILSTSIAQASLTVPGVRAVVDAGLVRLSRYDPAAGMDGLFTERLSRDDAEQRAGRAGRTGPGLCLRLWRADEELRAHASPEILRADLSPLLLECAAWGSEPGGLPFMDPPPASSLARAAETLRSLELLDSRGMITQEGRACVSLGAGPRLGRMLAREGSPVAAACAAILSERDRSGIEGDADLRHRLDALSGGGGASGSWTERVRAEYRRYLGLIASRGGGAGTGEGIDVESAGDALASAYPDRIAKREGGQYRFPSGRTARLAAAQGTHAGSLEGSEWIVAPIADPGDGLGLIRAAAPLSRAFVEARILPKAAPGLDIDWQGLSPRLSAYLGYGRIRLRASPGIIADASPGGMDPAGLVGESFMARLRAEGPAILPWTDASRGLLQRVRFFLLAKEGRAGGPPPPAFLADDALIGEAADWLLPFCDLPASLREGRLPPVLTEASLSSALASRVAPFRAALDREAPASIALPSGRSARLDYGEGGVPIIEGRVQEFFGLAAQPLAAGKPVLIRLLSPAGRPVQTTADIGGFWKNSYAEVRKDMRGRYPRHDWPEDGAAARPSRGPKRRRESSI